MPNLRFEKVPAAVQDRPHPSLQLICRDAHRTVGSLEFWGDDPVFISDIHVAPDRRRQGVASQMIEHLVTQQRLSLEQLRLVVTAPDQMHFAQAFAKSYGLGETRQ